MKGKQSARAMMMVMLSFREFFTKLIPRKYQPREFAISKPIENFWQFLKLQYENNNENKLILFKKKKKEIKRKIF